MTDHEALRRYESDCVTCSDKSAFGCFACKNRKAISALREREARASGCSDCTVVRGGKTLFKGSGMMGRNKFCPHCGRPLKGEDNETD